MRGERSNLVDAALPSQGPMNEPGERVVAGVDLGSNSFHMIVARREEDGRIHILDRMRDPVRLAAGLNEKRELTPKAIERALSALERFGQRLRGLPHSSVGAVGTNTLRRARESGDFLERAEAALGHPIQIISGHEEARLIYLGVAHSIADDVGRHLVVDIGGGSTELVIGARFETTVLDSLYVGCVSFTDRYFPNGTLSRDNFRRAELTAALELESLREQYRRIGWQRATGSSGTALAIHEVLRQNKWGDAITLEGLKRIRHAMIEQGNGSKLSIRGLEPDRAQVFPGGVAIMKAVFESLGIEKMQTSTGALREGIVYELFGRVAHEDVQEGTVKSFAERYRVDAGQADRVAATALRLFDQAGEALELDVEEARNCLRRAAKLHEIGLTIAYSGYHKHSAYILEYAEMPGFSRDPQMLLSTVVRAHRRKISRELFARLPRADKKPALHLSLLLRLAVRLHHSRSEEPLPEMRLTAERSTLTLSFLPGWLEAHALTRADLEQEAEQLRDVGVSLVVR